MCFQTQVMPYTGSTCITGQADLGALGQGCLGKVERQLMVYNLERARDSSLEVFVFVFYFTCVCQVGSIMCFLLRGWGERCPTSVEKVESI